MTGNEAAEEGRVVNKRMRLFVQCSKRNRAPWCNSSTLMVRTSNS